MNERTQRLAKAGAHLGYKTNKWNPKMSQYIFDEKEGIHLIDLNKTESQIMIVGYEIAKLIKSGKNVLFVGTKEQAKETIEKIAKSVDMPYVNNRWTGGMLTNFNTTKKSIKKIKQTEDGFKNEHKNKKETLMLQRMLDKLKKNFGSIFNLKRLPSAIFIIDPIHEHLAVAEANRLGIPVIAICDTNANPDKVDFVIPGNACSEKSINTILEMTLDYVHNLSENKQIAKSEIETI